MKTIKTVITHRSFQFAARLAVVCAIACLMVFTTTQTAHAQLEEVRQAMDNGTQNIQSIALPVGIFMLTVVFFSFLLIPMFRDWAVQNQRNLGIMLLAAVCIMISNEIVNIFWPAP